MQYVDGGLAGLVLGFFAGGFLAYRYANKLVAKAVAEYKVLVALEQKAVAAVKHQL
jgi:hypothetical protein